jgi:hypothetical protein
MVKRALVVGAQIRGLTGVHGDTARMVAWLSRCGFEDRDIDVRHDRAACRAGMLDGYDRLIADSRDGDVAVVYYSGHGAYVENLDSAVRGPRTFQCIVPTDIDESTDDDFRGISSWEMSIKQAALTSRTRNVTTILDCCHSAQMSRDSAIQDAVARALPHPLRVGLGRYFGALRSQQSEALDRLHPLANPDAVRLLACGQTETAFEYTAPDGTRAGVFTDALLAVLDDVGVAPISWGAVAAAVRQRVLARIATQRPDVEGPSSRLVLSLVEVGSRGPVPILSRGGRFKLLAGRIDGVSPGDVYGAMPLGSSEYDERRAVARVAVTRVSGVTSEATLVAWMHGHRALPADAVAAPVELAAPRRPVAVDAPTAERARIDEALAATRTLRAATPDEEEGALATLRLSDRELTIADRLGPLFPATRYPEDLARTVDSLVDIGVAHGLRELVGSHGVKPSEVEIEWGTVEAGRLRPMPATGGQLALGDRIYVQIRNTSHRRLFAHVLNIGLRHRVSMLTAEAPSGVLIDPGQPGHIVAEGVDPGSVRGLELVWPDGLPRDVARIDELIVIITTTRTNLQALETHDAPAPSSARGTSALPDLVAQLVDGQPRDVAGATSPADDFLISRMWYLLHPRTGGMAGLPFAVDEEPLNLRGARAAAAWIRPAELVPRSAIGNATRSLADTAEHPSAVAILLDELVVERNRALLAADIRIDALVCTLSRPGDAPYVVQTMRFPRIRDGERVPLDRALLYHGPVREFVDLCLWVSRDTTNSRALADLFAE